MSQPTADRSDSTASAARDRLRSGLPVSLGTALGALALVPTAGLLGIRALRNAPAGLPAVGRAAAPAVGALATVLPAFALLGLAAAADSRAERVALAAVGVFALVGAADGAAWLPAAAATIAGASAALAFALVERADARVGAVNSLRTALDPIVRPGGLAALGVLALAWSLAASAGIGTTTLRPAGAALTFATLAALPLARGVDGTVELGLWAVATVAVVVLAASAPFVAGAVVLVAFGAGTIPLALLALGIGGAVATVVADVRRRAFGPAVAATLLLFAGVPGTLPRAVAFALGLLVLVREWESADGTGPAEDIPTRDRTATPGGGTDA